MRYVNEQALLEAECLYNRTALCFPAWRSVLVKHQSTSNKQCSATIHKKVSSALRSQLFNSELRNNSPSHPSSALSIPPPPCSLSSSSGCVVSLFNFYLLSCETLCESGHEPFNGRKLMCCRGRFYPFCRSVEFERPFSSECHCK